MSGASGGLQMGRVRAAKWGPRPAKACYVLPMAWSAATLDGLLLAAAAGSVSSRSALECGLAEHVARKLDGELRTLDQLAPAERHAALRRAALRLSPEVDGSLLPARAKALLAATVDRDRGVRWLHDAPASRRGYVPTAGLRATLSRMARSGEAPAEDIGETRGQGRMLLIMARRLLPPDDPALVELRVESEEAAAVQALESVSGQCSTDLRHELIRLLLRASSARDEGVDVCLALGRLLRGARQDAPREPRARLERAGRELAEWTAATWRE